MKNLFKLILLFIGISFLVSCSNTKEWVLQSPGENTQILVKISESQQLTYQVNYLIEGTPRTALEESALGVEREDASFTQLEFISQEIEENVEDTYSLLSGKQLEHNSIYNGLKLSFKNEQGNLIDVYLRAYDEGIAFSYGFPEESDVHHRITKELTNFNLGEGFAWMHAYDTIADWAPGYETYYEQRIPIGTEAPPNKNGWKPLPFQISRISRRGGRGYASVKKAVKSRNLYTL